jgi:hypothetical protein
MHMTRARSLPGWLGLVSLCSLLATGSGAEAPAIRVLHAATAGKSVLANGDFEQGTATTFSRWQPAPQGLRVASHEGRQGTRALQVENPGGQGWVGASQTVVLNRTRSAPLTVRGWSKAEKVSGSADSDYSLYADLVYADGSTLWGQTAHFSCGTHDWQMRSLTILPDKPVKSITLHCLFRRHAGTAWFDDVAVEEVDFPAGTALYQGVAIGLDPAVAPAAGAPERLATSDGLALEWKAGRVSSLQMEGRELSSRTPSGFLVRDVAADSDFSGFSGPQCAALGLALETRFEVHANYLGISGRISDRTGKDRAITLVFALPLEAQGWQWGDDIHRERTIAGERDFANETGARCGATGTMSLYPWAAVHNEKYGLAVGIDLANPAQYRLGYHAGTQQFYAAFDFGLVPETQRFPGSADFRIIIFSFNPAWGFRAAAEKYRGLFPDYFAVRSPDQGIWMPFTDISKVQGWADFGFKYHEGNNNVTFDDAHQILSFRYTEPMTWWMSMASGIPRTPASALAVRDTLAQGQNAEQQRRAQISTFTAMQDETGQPCLLFRDEPWCRGAVWSFNPNPYLPVPAHSPATEPANARASPGSRADYAPLNAGTMHWNPALKERLYGAGARGVLDGEYLDSLEGYVTAELNFCRNHFRYTTVPLTFDRNTKKPALFKGLAVCEFTRWMADEVHRLGKLMFANGVPYRFTFLCPWLDVMGTETDWQRNGEYRPVPESQLALWRTMAGPKPYLLLMNTDFATFTPDRVERYFKKCLGYGFYPSMFSHNAADNPYWQNPNWYNRDRPLFLTYQPLIKKVAEAGWQPVTGARSNHPEIQVERFGPSRTGTTFFTVSHNGPTALTATLAIEKRFLKTPDPVTATELLGRQTLILRNGECSMQMSPVEVKVIQLETN